MTNDMRSDRDGNEHDADAISRSSDRYRPWTEEDRQRYIALLTIFGRERQGVVDGVEFDLRHELIDPKDWHTYMLGVDHFAQRSSHQPFIWFPWSGVFDSALLRAELEADCEKRSKPLNEKSIAFWIRQHTPEHFVNAGDKLVVTRVDRVAIDGPFAHEHDREFRLAHLRIVRSSGKSERVKTPLTFIGNMSMLAPRATKEHFDTVAKRIAAYFKIRSLSDFLSVPEDGSYAWGALLQGGPIERLTRPIRKLASKFPKSDAERDACSTMLLVNRAVAMGYLWAKAEDELGMQPLAEATLRAKLGGARGGRKSGEARRDVRAKTWERHARELAIAIRTADPTLSQDRVATEIASGWKETNFDPPSHQTLKALVSAMEKEGKLAPRSRG